MTEHYVLDASAVLCLIRDEPGSTIVKAALPDSSISAVNLSEVVAKMSDLGMTDALIDEVLDPLQLKIVPLDAGQAYAAGTLRRESRAFGLSLGDRACLTLAAQLGATALTTDRVWAKLKIRTKVQISR